MRILPFLLVLSACPAPAVKDDSGTATLPRTSTSNIEGRIWSVDLGAAESTPIQVTSLPIHTNLLTVTEDAGSTLALRIGRAAEDGAQDVCVPTIELSAVGITESRVFDTTVSSAPTTFDGHAVTLLQFHVSGMISADGSAITDGGLSWYAHASELAWLVEEEPPSEAICDALATFGESCVACPDDASADCVYVAFSNTTATEVDVPGLVVVEEPCAEG